MSAAARKPDPAEIAVPTPDALAAWAELGPPPEWDYRFHFESGRPALDFCATTGERWRRNFERLRSPADLGRWGMEAGLLSAAPEVSSRRLADARELREAIYRTARLAGEGTPAPADVELINRWAARRPLAPVLAADGRTATFAGDVEALLATLARDAIDLVTGPWAHRVRECASDTCALLFVDTSRPGRRRWCSMEGCGNRQKTATYQEKEGEGMSEANTSAGVLRAADQFWRPSNAMRVLNTDLGGQLGATQIGARLWRLAPGPGVDPAPPHDPGGALRAARGQRPDPGRRGAPHARPARLAARSRPTPSARSSTTPRATPSGSSSVPRARASPARSR